MDAAVAGGVPSWLVRDKANRDRIRRAFSANYPRGLRAVLQS